MKKVTIQDVAKELNLSRNTVAKALNNSNTVSYETRYVVIEKAYEMGYSKLSPVVLNEFKLRNKIDETKTIVVLTRREISVFWNSIIMGISDELNKYGCKLQFNFISEQDEKNLVLPLDLQAEVNGIIILSVFSTEYINQITKQNIPVVFLDAPNDLDSISQYGDIIICEGNHSIRKIMSPKNPRHEAAAMQDMSYNVSALTTPLNRTLRACPLGGAPLPVKGCGCPAPAPE
jgi:LacI family transcriptional regulator